MKATVNVTGVGEAFASSSESHPLNPDLVRVRVSQAMSRHYVRRQVFPHLRPNVCASFSGAYNLFWCSQSEAMSILEDAKAAVARAVNHEKNVLNSHIQNLEAEIDEARLRRKWLEGDEPKAIPIYSGTCYIATRAQLAALEVPEDLILPGSAGGPARKATFKSLAGLKCSIFRADSVWPGTFRVEIKVPEKRAAANVDEELAKLQKAPQTATAFRSERAESLDFAASSMKVPLRLKAPGFDYTSDTKAAYLDEVEASIARLRAILLRGAVIGDGPAPQIAARRAELAKQDRKLQGFLRIVHSSSGLTS